MKNRIISIAISLILGVGIAAFFLWDSFFPVRVVPHEANPMNYIRRFDRYFQNYIVNKTSNEYPKDLKELSEFNNLEDQKDLFGGVGKEWARFEEYRYCAYNNEKESKIPILLYKRKDLNGSKYIVLYSDSSQEMITGVKWDKLWNKSEPFDKKAR